MNWLYTAFPREVSRKRKLVYNEQEFIDYINRNNGYSEMVCTSLYGGMWINNKTPLYETSIIDKLAFDFDEGNNYSPIEEARKLDAFFDKHDIRRIRVFSGGGIHVIAQVKPTELKSPASAMKNITLFILATTGIKSDAGVGTYPSQHIRIINTYNIKRGKFCIPLTDKQFTTMSMPQLQGLATKQQKQIDSMTVGKYKIDISKYDEEPDCTSTSTLEGDDMEVTKQDITKNCMLIGKNAGNRERFILISTLVENAFSKQSISNYLKKVLSPSKYNHSVYIEHQVDTVYDRCLKCLSCENIKNYGLCKDFRENPCPYKQKEVK